MSYKKLVPKNRYIKPFMSNHKKIQNHSIHFGKDEVTGSNPVISSKKEDFQFIGSPLFSCVVEQDTTKNGVPDVLCSTRRGTLSLYAI